MIKTPINTFWINVVKAVLINIFGINHKKNAFKVLVNQVGLGLKNIGGLETTHVSKNVQFNFTFNKSIN